jgi:short-subunit dehydrogenase
MAEPIFRENVAVITGASAGIGKELALQLADQGAWLVLSARNRDSLEEAAAECRKRGGKALAIAADVGKEKDCKKLIDGAVKEYGRIDTLVCNAGLSMWARFDEMKSPQPFEEIMQVNYMGSVYCIFYALPHLKQSKGRLVGVSSLAGKTGVPTRTGYSASKHAMVGLFDSLRVELAGTGVSVTVIYPGFVATEIRERALGQDGKPLGKGNSPVRESEVMTAEECARIIVRAIGRRQREEVMTLRGKIGQWVKLIAPGLVDRIARRAIEEGK